jgi:hypothetical protein
VTLAVQQRHLMPKPRQHCPLSPIDSVMTAENSEAMLNWLKAHRQKDAKWLTGRRLWKRKRTADANHMQQRTWLEQKKQGQLGRAAAEEYCSNGKTKKQYRGVHRMPNGHAAKKQHYCC